MALYMVLYIGWATPEFLPNTRHKSASLDGSEKLLAQVITDTVFVNLRYDTDEWVINRLHLPSKIPVIPARRKRCNPRADNWDFYNTRQPN
jgi:hypothetical protein